LSHVSPDERAQPTVVGFDRFQPFVDLTNPQQSQPTPAVSPRALRTLSHLRDICTNARRTDENFSV
jgi:hypothetical protein